MDAPPIVLSPELLAHMREQPDSALTKFAQDYIQLALMLSGESDISNVGPGEARQLKPRLSDAEKIELSRELRKINEQLERMMAQGLEPPQS